MFTAIPTSPASARRRFGTLGAGVRVKEMRASQITARLLALAVLTCAMAVWSAGPGGRGLAPGDASQRRPAPAEVVRELQATLDRARVRFEARDAAGVLAHVSDQYRTGPMTKAEVHEQLLAMYEVYTAVRAHVVIDAVELVDGGAWVYTTGEISGRLPLVGAWMTVLWWERELEVARREGTSWRLFGYQQ